ncbi:MAG: methylenetetrahydrofolate--tRNA-(uracil(54)-C(5))-methyltransferase (FADH(2)-oxidizing) TrmFO [Anaerolineae bacterium]
MNDSITVIGGGLAGSEAAWQAARLGAHVTLYEMRPQRMTPAHTTGELAELVCSNSLGSNAISRAPGLLKEELRRLGSLIIGVADAHSLPAGSALAVDREGFAAAVTARVAAHPRIELVREEVTTIPAPTLGHAVIVASGPLTSPALTEAIQALTGRDTLYFYDAIAPIVELESIDRSIAFRASRYGRGESEQGDYINCPMTQHEYDAFYDALVHAERIALRDFEREDPNFFEGCLPVEVLAERGKKALAYGPLRPVGLRDPRTGQRPHAVVQLRQDNAAGTLYNLVGFQTNLKYGEQDRVLRMIPGLAEAEFVRYGSMHRNTYVNAPALLAPTLQFRRREDLFFAGQIAGLEGYAGNVAGGWLAGVNAARLLQGAPPLAMPQETMIGALMHYITHADPQDFQPMKANFGLVPPLGQRIRGKRARAEARAERALASLDAWLEAHPSMQPT